MFMHRNSSIVRTNHRNVCLPAGCLFFAVFTQNLSALTSLSENPKYVSICVVGVVLLCVDK
jgi:hypothetical protein